MTDPFLTSKIPYFVAQISNNPISHRDKYILFLPKTDKSVASFDRGKSL